MKMNFLRRLALLCAVLTCGMLLALPAAAAEADAPYAEDGDMDYIRSYVVTVDPREDGSVDITYDIDWQVIDGDKTDYLSWVKIGLANSSVDELTPLTDTISDLQYTSDGGSYAKVVFRHRYYAPDVAAANGGESSVHFAFSVHQSHLFTKNDDGTANFAFAPGWFDDLSVENMQVRWHNYDGFVADNTGVDGDYLTWDFGAMGHGQQAMVHVTVPVTNAAAFDPGAAMTTDDYDSGEDLDEIIGMLVTLVVVLLAIAIIIIAIASQSPEWGGGFGGGFSGGFDGDIDLGDIFSSFFGGGFGGSSRNPNAPSRGRDIQASVTLTFEEAAKGYKKTIEVMRVMDCSECGGTGAAKGTTPTVCPECHGSGVQTVSQRTPLGVMSTQRTCSRCGGTGKIINTPCQKCNGKGKVRTRKKIEVNIPAGIDNNQIVNVRGFGNAGSNGGPSGDLKVIISIKKHAYFKRDGYDVWFDKHISIVEATLGAEVEIPTLEGNVKLNIPAGTQPGEVFTLKGNKGITRLNGMGKGDEHVRIIVDIPKNVTSEQKQLLKEFDKTYVPPKNSGKEGFFDKFKKK